MVEAQPTRQEPREALVAARAGLEHALALLSTVYDEGDPREKEVEWIASRLASVKRALADEAAPLDTLERGTTLNGEVGNG